jgi:methylated-DNA-[protein]-cysteine S-methyltransferase
VELTLTMENLATPLGAFILVADEQGRLRAAEFADGEDIMRKLLDRRFGPSAYRLSPGRVPEKIKSALTAYFSGRLGAIGRIALQTDGTPFQNVVWTALQAIEPGRPLTYSALARRLGRPQSARAVGHANANNPLCIVIPCHRLVGASGALTGYSGGIERKRWLLDHEARHSRAI